MTFPTNNYDGHKSSTINMFNIYEYQNGSLNPSTGESTRGISAFQPVAKMDTPSGLASTIGYPNFATGTGTSTTGTPLSTYSVPTTMPGVAGSNASFFDDLTHLAAPLQTTTADTFLAHANGGIMSSAESANLAAITAAIAATAQSSIELCQPPAQLDRPALLAPPFNGIGSDAQSAHSICANGPVMPILFAHQAITAPTPVTQAPGHCGAAAVMGPMQSSTEHYALQTGHAAAGGGATVGGCLPNMAAMAAGQGAAIGYAEALGSVHGTPSLMGTPQLEFNDVFEPTAQSGMLLAQGFPISAPSGTVEFGSQQLSNMSSPFMTNIFDELNLGSSPAMQATPLRMDSPMHVHDAPNTVQLAASPVMRRSLSTRARMRSQATASPMSLGQIPRTAGHPYFPHSFTIAGTTRNGLSGLHNRSASGSLAGFVNNEVAAVGMMPAPLFRRQASAHSTGSSPLVPTKHVGGCSRPRAQSVVGLFASVSPASQNSHGHTSGDTNDNKDNGKDSDNDDNNDDDGDDDEDEDNDNDSEAKEGSQLSKRTLLTAKQKCAYFRWLYTHQSNPWPKGDEREQLRALGNMSKGRFKTWFANARRRYFSSVINEAGQKTLELNNRFFISCQRAKISLD
ncbi:hypothetical protein GGI07_002046 [Coemansia sp. Benny D115]|nr:hypothetical protein GGI07_002046 [Coemansia sp. Benny D115]